MWFRASSILESYWHKQVLLHECKRHMTHAAQQSVHGKGYPSHSQGGTPILGWGTSSPEQDLEQDFGQDQWQDWGTPRQDLGPETRKGTWDQRCFTHTCENSTFPILWMQEVITRSNRHGHYCQHKLCYSYYVPEPTTGMVLWIFHI